MRLIYVAFVKLSSMHLTKKCEDLIIRARHYGIEFISLYIEEFLSQRVLLSLISVDFIFVIHRIDFQANAFLMFCETLFTFNKVFFALSENV
jgi:ABC-type transport system involved in cytochrome bd biosynthesis fused ATPase/permease subunit